MPLKAKHLIHYDGQGSEKMRGEKMKVTSIMLLKNNGSKLSDFDLSIILLKNKIVKVIFPLC